MAFATRHTPMSTASEGVSRPEVRDVEWQSWRRVVLWTGLIAGGVALQLQLGAARDQFIEASMSTLLVTRLKPTTLERVALLGGTKYNEGFLARSVNSHEEPRAVRLRLIWALSSSTLWV